MTAHQDGDGSRLVRLSVNLSAGTDRILRDIAGRRDASITEALHQAIRVWQFMDETLAQGKRLAVVDEDGTVREVVVLL